MLLGPAILLPRVCHTHWAEAAVRLAVICVDAEVEEPRGIAACAGEADQGVACLGGNFREGHVLTISRCGAGGASHGGPGLAVVERDLIIQTVTSIARSIMGAEAKPDHVSRCSDRKSDGAF